MTGVSGWHAGLSSIGRRCARHNIIRGFGTQHSHIFSSTFDFIKFLNTKFVYELGVTEIRFYSIIWNAGYSVSHSLSVWHKLPIRNEYCKQNNCPLRLVIHNTFNSPVPANQRAPPYRPDHSSSFVQKEWENAVTNCFPLPLELLLLRHCLTLLHSLFQCKWIWQASRIFRQEK